jgi:hypothetical protein
VSRLSECDKIAMVSPNCWLMVFTPFFYSCRQKKSRYVHTQKSKGDGKENTSGQQKSKTAPRRNATTPMDTISSVSEID